jgi:oxepin-CoA hydrolase/3-oxo-5,6-dehydrosuberyl-CoA semialdehyde dehydrogenase
MVDYEKLQFIRETLIPLLSSLNPADKGLWGRMNAQQMVEHLSDFFRLSSGKIHMPVVSPEEHLPKLRAFLHSNKPFRENTKAPVLPEDPLPVRCTSMNASLEELNNALAEFLAAFTANPQLNSTHPVFGVLNEADWVQLHHKHVGHHLRQFNLLHAE